MVKYLPGTEPDEIKPLLNMLFSEIDVAYPNKKIYMDTWNHARWDKAAGTLCSFLGYDNGRDFLTSYGYIVLSSEEDATIGGNNYESIHSKKTGNDESTPPKSDNFSNNGIKYTAIKCPNCAASLSVEDGIDTFYCQYCGTKVIVSGQSDATVQAKEAVKRLHHKEVMADKVINELNTIFDKSSNERKANKKTALYIVLGCVIVYILLMVFITHEADKDSKKIDDADLALQAIVVEIQQDIDEGAYDEALIKANTLYFTESSNSMKEKWNNTREALIEQIKELQEEEDTANESVG